MKWSIDDMKSFISDYNLKTGDLLTVYFLVPNGTGGFFSAGGREYLIIEEGWKIVDNIRGT